MTKRSEQAIRELPLGVLTDPDVFASYTDTRFAVEMVPDDRLVRVYRVVVPVGHINDLIASGEPAERFPRRELNEIASRRFAPGKPPRGSAASERAWLSREEGRCRQEALQFADECNARYFGTD